MKRRDPRVRSRAFTAPKGKGIRAAVDGVPPDLYKAFRLACAKQGVSMRARLLTLMQQDVAALAAPAPPEL